MYEDRWSVVSWPTEYGGRGPRHLRVARLRGGVLPGPRAQAGEPERHLPPGAHHARVRDRGAEGALSPAHGRRRRSLVPGLVGARRRQRPGRHPLARHADAAGDGWVLDGQKTWASRGAFAEWCFGIFRTDPEAERHRGLTYFLVAMDSPGVTVRPIPQIDGETGFAEIFFDQVEVPWDQVLGEVGAGWTVAMATAGSERGLSLRSPARYTEAADRLVELFRQRGGPPASADAVARATSPPRPTGCTPTGPRRGGQGRRRRRGGELQQDLVVRDGRRHPHRRARPARPRGRAPPRRPPGEWLDGYLFSLAGPIYAGTNEIQRNVVAERLLGLPRGGARWPERVDFAFSDEQQELRELVRTVLDTECTPDALRAFELADDEGPRHWRDRWAAPAELGAPALVVPESAGGLGRGDVDLVGVLEEAGRACLPNPCSRRPHSPHPSWPRGRPTVPPRPRCEALVEDDAPFAVGGVDVTPAGTVSPSEVTADGMLRTPARWAPATRSCSSWPVGTTSRAAASRRARRLVHAPPPRQLRRRRPVHRPRPPPRTAARQRRGGHPRRRTAADRAHGHGRRSSSGWPSTPPP